MTKILIVDDDPPDVVEACTLVLEHQGYQVASACNRDSGMKAVEKEKPDLLILDVMMEQPDDGLRMARDLRSEGKKLPILMLTSISKVTGMEFDRDDEMVPVNDFVEKPVDAAILLERIETLLK